MTELFKELLSWVTANPEWAYLSVFLVAFAESMAIIGLIVPGVIMMIGAGALISTGALDFWPVCLWAIAGAIAGDGLSYWIGHHYRERLSSLWPFSRYPESLSTGIRFFEKYGGKSVAFGRFVGPVRAVIPLVAGMMGMTPGHFLVANVLSAVLWAPAYLLPGIVFGASLELAAEAAFHLVILLLALVILIWAAAWGIRQIFLLYSPRAKGWVEALLRWAELHPRMGDMARALADPSHPAAGTLTALAGILVLTTVLFALVTGFAIAGAPEIPLNQTVLELARGLQMPAADHLMAALARLGDLAVTLPLALVASVWLFRRGERRQAAYWIAAGAFAILAGPLIKVLLQVPSPDIGLAEPSRWSFPSSHTLRATVIYGFLAVAVAGGMTTAWRWLPYVWASILVTAIGISQLYLGTHWLTDVLGSLTLGLAWVAALGLAYRRHTSIDRSWRGLGAFSLGTLAIAFGIQSTISAGPDLDSHRPQSQPISITEAGWRDSLWRDLPKTRDDLLQTDPYPLNFQYAGTLDVLRKRLSAQGWHPAERLSWGTAIKLLSPSLPLSQLPVIPHAHQGRYPSLTLVKQASDGDRLVMRVWATAYRIGGTTPLWVGNVTTQRKRLILNLLAIPATTRDTPGPLESVRRDFAELHPFRPAANGPLLLQAGQGSRSSE